MTVQQFLETKQVPFEVLPHLATYDSQRMAHTLHVSGHDVAKTVLIRCDGECRYAVAVLPASQQLDLEKAAQAVGAQQVELATELEIQEQCPDCELGALPPFGSCYQMLTIADESLAEHEQIFFEGDTHRESIRMTFDDFCQIEQPIVASLIR